MFKKQKMYIVGMIVLVFLSAFLGGMAGTYFSNKSYMQNQMLLPQP